jgi:ketosteroid isomerase-like protein
MDKNPISNDENKNVILRWFDAVNKGDVSLLDQLADELFTEDFIEHDPRMPDFMPGPAGIKNLIHQVREEFTDIHATVHDIFSQGDKSAYRFTLSMTEIASGEPVSVQLLATAHFVGSRMAEEWQLGVRGKW